jgi:hypothetical protein
MDAGSVTQLSEGIIEVLFITISVAVENTVVTGYCGLALEEFNRLLIHKGHLKPN